MIIIMIKSHLILMASLFSEERRSKQKEQEKQNCTDVGDHDARLIEGLKLCGKHYSIYIAIFYIKNSYLKSIRVVATK